MNATAHTIAAEPELSPALPPFSRVFALGYSRGFVSAARSSVALQGRSQTF